MEAMGELSQKKKTMLSLLTDLRFSDERYSKLSNKAIKNKDDLAELSC